MNSALKAGRSKMKQPDLIFDKTKTLVFLDFETLNLCLNFKHNLPWQLGMIEVREGKKIAEKDFLIKWDTDLRISTGARIMTRYDQKKIDKEGLSPEEVFPTMEDWLDKADFIIGHNILGFDVYLIKEYYKHMGKSALHLLPKFIDTNCVAKGIAMGVEYAPREPFIEYQYRMYHTKKKGVRTNLARLLKDYDIPHDKALLHDAIYDLERNLDIWNKLKYHIENKDGF